MENNECLLSVVAVNMFPSKFPRFHYNFSKALKHLVRSSFSWNFVRFWLQIESSKGLLLLHIILWLYVYFLKREKHPYLETVYKKASTRRKTFRLVLSTRRKVSPDLFASELESFWLNALFQ